MIHHKYVEQIGAARGVSVYVNHFPAVHCHERCMSLSTVGYKTLFIVVVAY